MAETTDVAVIGGGAIGGYLAAAAAAAGHRVTLCVRTPIETLRAESSGQTRLVSVRIATDPDQVAAAKLIPLAAKTHQTGGTLPWLRRLIGPGSTVVAVQNGVDDRPVTDAVHAAAPAGTRPAVVPTTVYLSSTLCSPGHIVYRPGGLLYLPDDDDGRRVASLLTGADLTVASTPEFETLRWRKFCLNVAAGAVTALFRQPLGIVRQSPIDLFAHTLAAEAAAVGARLGHDLGADLPAEIVADLQSRPPGHGTSMLRDRLAGRPLEIGALNQTVVDRGAAIGVPTPLNRTVVQALTGPEANAEPTAVLQTTTKGDTSP